MASERIYLLKFRSEKEIVNNQKLAFRFNGVSAIML